MRWKSLRRPELSSLPPQTPLILPVAAVEQHGDHLPLDTDIVIAETVATQLDEALGHRLLVLPTQQIGCSEHHMSFAGSLTLDHETFASSVIRVAESAFRHGFVRLLILNGHGGNQAANGLIVERLGQEHPTCETVAANWWTPAAQRLLELQEGPVGSVGHACEFETSVMLVVAPDRVDMASAVDDGYLHRASALRSDLLHGPAALAYRPFDELSKTGVYGRPSLASVEKGRHVLEAVNSGLVRLVCELWPDFAPAE